MAKAGWIQLKSPWLQTAIRIMLKVILMTTFSKGVSSSVVIVLHWPRSVGFGEKRGLGSVWFSFLTRRHGRMRTINIRCTAKTLEQLRFSKPKNCNLNRKPKTTVSIRFDIAKNHGFAANFDNRKNTIEK